MLFSIINIIINGLNFAVRELWSFIRGIINGAGSIIKDIGDALHKDWGWELKVSAPQIPKIPKLANGAVIPGGNPFIAMLGDQKAGQTNIEAPLDTIVEAFKRAGGGQPQNITITAEGSMAQFIKMLNLKIKQENGRASVW